MSYDTNPLSKATPHDAGADICDLCRRIDVLSAIVKNQDKIIDFLRKRAESADLRKLAAVVSSVPCCVCQGPVVEFVRSNEEWNATMRPDGREHDGEYLCASCYMNAIAARAEAAEAKIEWLQKERRSICQIMNGRDDFPGDLPQYIRNQVSGRTAAEAALAESEKKVVALEYRVHAQRWKIIAQRRELRNLNKCFGTFWKGVRWARAVRAECDRLMGK